MGETINNPQQNSDQFAQVKKHLLKYSQPNDRLAWRSIIITVIFELFTIILIKRDFNIIGWTLHTLVQVRIFVIFHDMAHFNFFSKPFLNKLFGRIIGIYVHFPFEAWRDGHNHHHRHFGNLDRIDLSQTILFTKKQYQASGFWKKIFLRVYRQPIIFFLISAPYVWFIGLIYVVGKRYGIMSRAFSQKILSFVLVFYIFPKLGVSSFYICLTTYMTDIIGTMLFHLQHSVNLPYRQTKQKWNFSKAALEGSTYLYVPKLLRPFTNGIQYHHIHHFNTNVASYAIQSCHEEFDQKQKGKKHWDNFHINRVDWKLALKSLLNVMLDQNKNLVPFSYSKL